MKKILSLAFVALAFTACNDGFLDRQPLDAVSDEAVFNNAGLSQAYVNALYTSIPDPMQEANISCITDEAYFRFGGTSTRYMADGTVSAENVVYSSQGGPAHDSRTTILNIWTRSYDRIRKMNIFIRNMKTSSIDEATKNSMLGEVYFLRAWVYTNLIQRYAGVPIIEDVYALGEEYNAERDNFDDCVKFIYSDLDKAYELLPEKEASVLGRANKDVVLALRSRLALIVASPLFNDIENPEGGIFRGAYSKDKWQTAFDAAKAIVDRADTDGAYRLADTYDGYWKDLACPEVIWAKYFTPNSGNKAQLEYTPESEIGGYESMSPTESLIIDYEMTNGKKFFEEGSGYDPKHPWANRDPRLYKTILLNFQPYRDVESFEYCLYYQPGVFTVDNTPENLAKYPLGEVDGNKIRAYPHGYTKDDFVKGKTTPDHTGKSKYMLDAKSTTSYNVMKWHLEDQPVVVDVNYSLMFPWFRLAEFYLNYAEAAYMLGKEDIARTYINKIRARKDVRMPAVTESGTNLWDRLVNERRIEFALENQRYFDVRRWKIAPFYENVPWLSCKVMILIKGDYYKDENGSIKTDESTAVRDTIYRVAKVYDPATDRSFHEDTYTYTYPVNSKRSMVFEYKWLGKTYKIDYGECIANLAPTEKAWDDKMYLQPIPANEMQKTGGRIVQNPGY